MNTTAPLTITLAIERPGESVQTHTFRGEKALVGRETGEIVLRDAESSALHAEIDCTQGAVVVRDLGSSNGTWRGKAADDGVITWERLPQFALLPGGSFRCGATIIRLVELEGAAFQVPAGRTVVSASRPASASPAASHITVTRGGAVPPPSSAATLPGKSEGTIVGQPPPGGAIEPTESSVTLPFGEAAPRGELLTSSSTLPATDDASTTMRAPTHVTDLAPPTASTSTVVAPAPMPDLAPPVGSTSTVVAPTSPLVPAPPVVPPPAAASPVVGRPPVANALIRPGGRPITGPTATVPAGPKPARAWLRKAGIGAAIVAVIALVGGGIWWAVRRFTGGPPALAVTIARELPDDALGFVAIASPRAQLDLVGDAAPEPMRKEASDALGFDPFTLASWTDRGIDPDGEIGVALLELGKPTLAVSMGLGDATKLRAAIPALVAKLGGVPEPTLSERTFGAVPGLWLESPVPAALLLRDRRVMAVIGLPGADASTVARHAERLAALESGASLAERPGFTDLGPEPGAPLMVTYVDGVSMRSAVPAGAPALLALRTGFSEIDAFSFTVSRDGPRLHAAWQTVLRDGSSALKYLGDVERTGRATARIPGPALAGMDFAVAATPVLETLTAFATLAGVLGPAETEFKASTGLDLRADVFDNVGGELGVVLGRLPSKKDGLDFAVVGFASVKDAKKAATSLHTALGALQRHVFESPATTESFGETAVHTFTIPVGDESFPVSLFVAADHVWIAAGKVDARAIVEGSGKSIRDTARHEAIREALAPGDSAAGFVDLRELLGASDPLMSEGDRTDKATAKPLLDPLEVLTLRARTKGRVSRVAVTLHTSVDDAATTLVRASFQVAGDALAEAVGRERRRSRCAELVAALEAIAKTDTSRTLLDFSLRFDVRDACETKATPEQVTCAIAAKTFAEVEACGGAEAGLLPPEPEPQAVPYVEDIWPNTRASPSDGAVPRPEVNYGVDVGDDPVVRGRADALVTIVEFGDFQCPYCREVTATLDDLLARHGDDVRVVFRQNPLAIHADARPAAKAALAAARQGKFWEMHDKLFDSQYELSSGKFRDYAIALGLDAAKFDLDLADAALDRRIDADLAVAKRFGVTGTPAFFINGRFLSGNQPAGVFDRVINEELSRARTFVERRGNTRKRLYDDMIGRWATEVGRSTAVALPPDSGERFTFDLTGMPQRGATGFSRVTLVECGDFECPYCQRATKTVQRILADYPTQVVFAFAHNPLSFHPHAEPAARAAAAADLQGKFWEMHDKLFGDADALDDASILLYAKELKLDVAKFEADRASAEVTKKVADQKKLCVDNGGSSTPTFFLNGRRIEGAQSFETFKALIDAELLGGI